MHKLAASAFSRCMLLVFAAVASTSANAEVEVVHLRNRPAAEMIPIVLPLLDADSKITGNGFTLILDVPADRRDELLAVIEDLDEPLQQLRITVRQGEAGQRRNEELSASGGIDAGARVSVGNTRLGGSADADLRSEPRSSVSGSGSRESVTLAARTLSTRSRSRDDQTQQVTAVAGKPAQIYVGVDVPYPNSYSNLGGLHEGVEFRRVVTGFSVLAQVRGDRVTLEISPQKQRLADDGRDQIEVLGASTVVTGRLGEWIEGGTINASTTGDDSALLYSAGSSAKDQRSIYFHVEAY